MTRSRGTWLSLVIWRGKRRNYCSHVALIPKGRSRDHTRPGTEVRLTLIPAICPAGATSPPAFPLSCMACVAVQACSRHAARHACVAAHATRLQGNVTMASARSLSCLDKWPQQVTACLGRPAHLLPAESAWGCPA